MRKKTGLGHLLAIAAIVALPGVAAPVTAGSDETLAVIVEHIRPGGACAVPVGTNDAQVLSGAKLPGPVEYRLNRGSLPDGVTFEAFAAALQGAAAPWNAALGSPSFLRYAGETRNRAGGARDGVNTIAFGGARGAFAVAYIWASGNTITEVDMEFAKGYRWSTNGGSTEDPGVATYADDCGGADGRADLQDIATHEFGHWFGLGHTPAGGEYNHRTMFPYASYKELFKRSPAPGDRSSVRQQYGLSP